MSVRKTAAAVLGVFGAWLLGLWVVISSTALFVYSFWNHVLPCVYDCGPMTPWTALRVATLLITSHWLFHALRENATSE